jgi:light-regulated signal transduction histidine kinase (bacteriophytochrome)
MSDSPWSGEHDAVAGGKADIAPLDLSVCETELIQLLNQIQPHGCLLAVSATRTRITHASANTAGFLGHPAQDLLGRPVETVLPPELWSDVGPLLETAAQSPAPRSVVCSVARANGPEPWAVTVHAHAGRRLIEIESLPVGAAGRDGAGTDADGTAAAWIADQSRNTHDTHEPFHVLADRTVRAVAEAIGYDRVMMYRFLPDWSGEVIAEARRRGMEPYVGLRYPASDIPPQARRLYTLNLLRAIADVWAVPVPILAEPEADAAGPPDLSLSVLRSVSAYHIEYLRNMGVTATVTASIIVNGALWGMIACHHRTPRQATPQDRAALTGLVEEFSEQVQQHLQYIEARRAAITDLALRHFRARLESGANPVGALLTGTTRLHDVLESQGAAIIVEDTMVLVGRTPPVAAVQRILALAQAAASPVFTTDDIAETLRAAEVPPIPVREDEDAEIAGIAMFVLPGTPTTALAVFRPAEVRDVFWAGDPKKPVIQDGTGISPRRSFAVWKETHTNKSRGWETWEIDLLARCGRELGELLRDHLDGAGLRQAATDLGNRVEAAALEAGGLMESVADALALIVGDGARGPRLAAANHIFRDLFDMTGADGSAHSGADAPDAFAPIEGTLSLTEDVWTQALARPVTREFWSRARGRRAVDLTARLLLKQADQTGTRTWTILCVRDVTAERRSREALESAREQAEQASIHKSEVLANVSHDIKTPLNAIVGFAGMIGSGAGGEASDNVREYAQIIEGAGQHLIALIEDLLNLARSESGHAHLTETTVDLCAMIADCLDLVKGQPGAAELSWIWNAPTAPILIRVDQMACRRSMLNLLNNALKFTPAGGRVTVEASRQENGGVVVSVIDTGLGIEADEQTDIFLPFRRGTSARTSRREGAGLGLAMVKATVESHGGQVTVSSTVGRGSTFRISLPAHRVVAPG